MLVCIVLSCSRQNATAQSTLLPLGTDDYHLLDASETLSGRITDTACLSCGAIYRSDAVSRLNSALSRKKQLLTPAEVKAAKLCLSANGEWPCDSDRAVHSVHPIFKTFYTAPSDCYRAYQKDFFIAINPVVNLMATEEKETSSGISSSRLMLLNMHGGEIRGRISNKVGFYTMLSDNQERMPGFLTSYKVGAERVVPGRDYFTAAGSAGSSDYFYANGYVDFAAVPDHIHITFGTGKNFIGDGMRSLFLSDNAANTPYLKFSTNWGRFHYQNLYLELTPRYNNLNIQLPHTYATLHYLNYRAANWLNLGLFEASVFATPNCYHLGYLNPVIMSRYLGQYGAVNGKEMAGISFKAIALKHLQFYGQFLVDDAGAPAPSGNRFGVMDKYGVQFGGKYFNAFAIPNLDLQAEVNMVKPYTYASTDSVVSYATYNQALAHPLGSGFIEMIGLARYQPAPKIVLALRATYYRRGADVTVNEGNDLFKPTTYLVADPPYINGVATNCKMVSGNISFQLFPNVFLDVGGAMRSFNTESSAILTTSTGTTVGINNETWLYFGFRMNATRRAYDAWY